MIRRYRSRRLHEAASASGRNFHVDCPRLHFEHLSGPQIYRKGFELINSTEGWYAETNILDARIQFVVDGDYLYVAVTWPDMDENMWPKNVDCTIDLPNPNQFGRVANEVMRDICNHVNSVHDTYEMEHDVFPKWGSTLVDGQ